MLDDFAQGIDLRKSPVAATPGSLRTMTNAVVSAGGEIEKRQLFTDVGTLPAGLTHGLSFNGYRLVVFGDADPALVEPLLPPYVRYHRLFPSDAETVVDVLDAQFFGAVHYVIVRMTDDSVRHFYNNVEVTDPGAQGTTVYAHKSKLYATDGPNLRFSAVADATDWGAGAGAGAGIIDVTIQDSAGEELVGIEQYYSSVALFGQSAVQVWAMDPDPDLNQQVQVLGNTGLLAPHGLARASNGDVLFLSNTGIRSLRARDSSTSATLNDVGSPIDVLIAAKRGLLTDEIALKIRALVDPLSGRFWLIWENEAFVLSTFPSTKIAAWSRFEFPYTIDAATKANARVALRSGDQLFLYGATPAEDVNPYLATSASGAAENSYDDTVATVETAFLDAGDPAASKAWTGLDVTCSGVWDVYINVSLSTPSWLKVARVSNPTWALGRVPLDMRSTHIQARMVSVESGPAVISSMALHYKSGEKS